MATIQDIAREAGLSVGTVSKILNGKRKRTRSDVIANAEHVHAIAKRLNFRPSGAARAMVQQCSYNCGILIRNTPASRYHYLAVYEIILGINERLQQAGYLTTLIRIDDIAQTDVGGPRIFTERLIDGLIVISGMPNDVISKVDLFFEQAVWVESSVWRATRCLRRDEVAAGRMAAEALIQNGCKRIVWFGYELHDNSHYSLNQRLSGAQAAAQAAGIPFEMHPVDIHFVITDEMLGTLKDRTGVIAYNSLIAQAIINAAYLKQLSIGGDYALVSCDSEADGQLTFPQLSRVEFDRFAMGVAAAEMFLQTQQTPEKPCKSSILQGIWIAGQTA